MTENSSSKLRSPKFVALSLLIGLGFIILFPIVGPFLIASNQFRLADRLSFLPGINETGGRNSGILAAIYIIGGFLLIGGSVMAATGAVPGIDGSGPDEGTSAVTATATPTATPQQVSDTRKQEYKAFVQNVDSYSARSPRTWSGVNGTALNMTFQADWTVIKRYNNQKHPVPESVLRAMNSTENPPKRVTVNFENENGDWLRTVTVKEQWADPFFGYELGIDAMQNRFRETTVTTESLPEDVRIPRFHVTFDDVRHAYANGIREKLTNQSWQPDEYNYTARPKIGEAGLYHYDITLQNNVTISKDRVIYVNVLQEERGGHALGFVPSAYAELIDEQHYGIIFGDPGLVLRVRLKDPETGEVWHTADVRSTWAQQYNVGHITWAQYSNLVVFRG